MAHHDTAHELKSALQRRHVEDGGSALQKRWRHRIAALRWQEPATLREGRGACAVGPMMQVARTRFWCGGRPVLTLAVARGKHLFRGLSEQLPDVLGPARGGPWRRCEGAGALWIDGLYTHAQVGILLALMAAISMLLAAAANIVLRCILADGLSSIPIGTATAGLASSQLLRLGQ